MMSWANVLAKIMKYDLQNAFKACDHDLSRRGKRVYSIGQVNKVVMSFFRYCGKLVLVNTFL